ncbi:MAG TPA: tRNA lysidine(34) synthetase TilS [Rhizomicrobium sp.]|nr:tRNA lysidine(34) synthetase TilS [Rhizomicrobium sp.]
MTKLAAPWPGAVAVSGGGDSLALMHLLCDWSKAQGREAPVVLTVDHGLQKDSAAKAKQVVAWAKRAGLKAHVLAWEGKKPKSDVEAESREARYRLMGAWCRKRGLAALYVGHTRDDQAETFLLRLARGSGLDGLAAMRPVSAYPVQGFRDLLVVRPLLEIERDALRTHLTARGQEWFEDPMNSDPRFSRVRIRAALDHLRAAGLAPGRIADAAAHLSRAREALDAVTAAVMRRACRSEGEAVLVDSTALLAAPREVGLRAIATMLMAVSGQAYRPRFERLERLYDSIAGDRLGGARTLHGCRIGPASGSDAYFGTGTLRISREPGRRTPEKGRKSGRIAGGETGS